MGARACHNPISQHQYTATWIAGANLTGHMHGAPAYRLIHDQHHCLRGHAGAPDLQISHAMVGARTHLLQLQLLYCTATLTLCTARVAAADLLLALTSKATFAPPATAHAASAASRAALQHLEHATAGRATTLHVRMRLHGGGRRVCWPSCRALAGRCWHRALPPVRGCTAVLLLFILITRPAAEAQAVSCAAGIASSSIA